MSTPGYAEPGSNPPPKEHIGPVSYIWPEQEIVRIRLTKSIVDGMRARDGWTGPVEVRFEDGPDGPQMWFREHLKSEPINDVLTELTESERKHGSIHSRHEGYAIILEEVDEYWEEAKTKEPDTDKLYKELIQVAAMALRTIKGTLHHNYAIIDACRSARFISTKIALGN